MQSDEDSIQYHRDSWSNTKVMDHWYHEKGVLFLKKNFFLPKKEPVAIWLCNEVEDLGNLSRCISGWYRERSDWSETRPWLAQVIEVAFGT